MKEMDAPFLMNKFNTTTAFAWIEEWSIISTFGTTYPAGFPLSCSVAIGASICGKLRIVHNIWGIRPALREPRIVHLELNYVPSCRPNFLNSVADSPNAFGSHIKSEMLASIGGEASNGFHVIRTTSG
jgi:hypothetical protein